MNFQDFADKIGVKYDIVNGNLVQSNTGPFTVTETLNNCCIYVNKSAKTAQLIVPSSMYIGRPSILQNYDSVKLALEWSDKNQGTNLLSIYKNYSTKKFYDYYSNNIGDWFIDIGLSKQTEVTVGSFIVYKLNEDISSYIGICVAPEKILHHSYGKLSSIDNVEYNKIIGIYKYGN